MTTITNVKRIASQPPTYKFHINGEPAVAVITAWTPSAPTYKADIFCNQQHITLYDTGSMWHPEALSTALPPKTYIVSYLSSP